MKNLSNEKNGNEKKRTQCNIIDTNLNLFNVRRKTKKGNNIDPDTKFV